jgi:HAMP domain-containing protein
MKVNLSDEAPVATESTNDVKVDEGNQDQKVEVRVTTKKQGAGQKPDSDINVWVDQLRNNVVKREETVQNVWKAKKDKEADIEAENQEEQAQKGTEKSSQSAKEREAAQLKELERLKSSLEAARNDRSEAKNALALAKLVREEFFPNGRHTEGDLASRDLDGNTEQEVRRMAREWKRNLEALNEDKAASINKPGGERVTPKGFLLEPSLQRRDNGSSGVRDGEDQYALPPVINTLSNGPNPPSQRLGQPPGEYPRDYTQNPVPLPAMPLTLGRRPYLPGRRQAEADSSFPWLQGQSPQDRIIRPRGDNPPPARGQGFVGSLGRRVGRLDDNDADNSSDTGNTNTTSLSGNKRRHEMKRDQTKWLDSLERAAKDTTSRSSQVNRSDTATNDGSVQRDSTTNPSAPATPDKADQRSQKVMKPAANSPIPLKPPPAIPPSAPQVSGAQDDSIEDFDLDTPPCEFRAQRHD